ncbi:MAG TPA: macro domain-containing protein [Thermomicrobiales bacterium]|nr:macro domain-containing protein [Thermomicrobiales bacterium]
MRTQNNNLLQEPGVRFGRTLVIPSAEPIFEHRLDAIATPANRRGVMGVGVSGQIRIHGGTEIEREAMALAPLTMGSAVVTSAGKLAEQGTRAIIHAVISDALGTPTREHIIREATMSTLAAADRQRFRSLVLPPLGNGPGIGRYGSDAVLIIMSEEVVAHLRRFTSRLERIVLVCHDAREVRDLEHALIEARRQWWGLQV